jgi:hypothetical protein
MFLKRPFKLNVKTTGKKFMYLMKLNTLNTVLQYK